MFNLIKELVHVIPNAAYYKRKDVPFTKIAKYAANKGFTSVIVFSEKHKNIDGMYLCHLPCGPTMFWRIQSLKLASEMPEGAACNASDMPELVIKNFSTRLGEIIIVKPNPR